MREFCPLDRSRPRGASPASRNKKWKSAMDDILLLFRVTANHNQTLVSTRIAR